MNTIREHETIVKNLMTMGLNFAEATKVADVLKVNAGQFNQMQIPMLEIMG